MKKAIFICLFVIGMITQAQSQNQIITKPLQLNSVATGTGASSEKVLVRGTDKVIKEVAKSTLGTNVGLSNFSTTTIDITSSTGGGITIPQATTLQAGLLNAADKGKLNGVASGATANSTDAQLRDRSTHTGAQAISTVTGLQSTLDLKAPIASPVFTGIVSGITSTMVGLGSVNNTSDVNKPVSTAQQTALDLKAPIASPTLTGTPTAPTATIGTNTAQIATTAFVLANAGSLPSMIETNATDKTMWNNGKANIVSNLSYGDGALKANTTGNTNTAIGNQAMFSTTTGVINTAVGFESMYSATTSNNNTAVGYQTLRSLVTGYNNTAIGDSALKSHTSGNSLVAVGSQTLLSNTTGTQNTGVGAYALKLNTTGWNMTAVGYESLYSNTTGYDNVGVGYQTLRANQTGSSNTAMGQQALYSNTSNFNTALGFMAAYANTTGNSITAVGANALQYTTTGYNNTALGYSALQNNTTGYSNVAIGDFAGAMLPNYSGNNTGSNSIYIGTQIKAAANGLDNVIAIGANMTGNGSNTVTIGNASIEKTFLKGVLSVGITTDYADNAAALAGGLVAGQVYRTGDLLKVVH